MTQEEIKVQELLKPRIKVIAPWPEMERWYVNEGDILIIEKQDTRHEKGYIVAPFEFEKYPHLFRKLEWWEERSESEMPQYVKPDPNGVLDHLRTQKVIYQVKEWVKDNDNVWCKVGDHDHIHINHILPASEADYLAYTNKK